MEHIAAYMLLIACSHDLAACEEISRPAAYETVQACEHDMQSKMLGATTAGPEIIGKCVPVDPALSNENVELDWTFASQGSLTVAVKRHDGFASRPVYASNAFGR